MASKEKPLVWLKLDASHADDPIAQGNKLSDAFTKALDTPLFGYGMHYNYAVAFIKNHLSLLGPFTFALSGAEHSPGLVKELLTLHYGGSTVLIHFETPGPTFKMPKHTKPLTRDFLVVTPAEALKLAEGFYAEEQIAEFLQISEGAYERFTVLLAQQRSLPVALRPTPEGFITPPYTEGLTVDPQVLLEALIKRERWMEAFEIAVRYAPLRVPEVMEEAGHLYHERGLHKRLWQLLEQLPEGIKKAEESVLFCRLQAGFRINLAESVKGDVEAYLARYEAPRLRALHAGAFFSFETSLINAKRAYDRLKDPLTTSFYGHLLRITRGDTLKGINVLQDSVELAKQKGRGYEIIVNTQRFAGALSEVGKYKEAYYHTKLALESFYERDLGDWQRYLELLNSLCSFQLLADSEKGVLEKIKENEAALAEVNLPLAMKYQSTIADCYVVTGQPAKAIRYYKSSLKNSNSISAPYFTLELVKALLSSQKIAEALTLAEEIYSLSGQTDNLTKYVSMLGYGMVLALKEPKKSLEYLEPCFEFFFSIPSALYCASASLFLARAYLTLGGYYKARDVLEKARPYLAELSQTGLLLLSGSSEIFEDVWAMIQPSSVPLYLKCLGEPEVHIEAKELSMPLRWYEILSLLASHPSGLRSEQLLAMLYGDGGNLATLKATLSKMRQYIPLSSRVYKIAMKYKADFLEVEEYLNNGEIDKALKLYQGPLLPKSSVPNLTEMREILDEKVRQAVLHSNDHKLFEQYAHISQDDHEVLRRWFQVIPQNHPKRVFIKAKIRQAIE
ncbi:MAG: tetratricopeptide repeat protein [Trueperaceae bacterium]